MYILYVYLWDYIDSSKEYKLFKIINTNFIQNDDLCWILEANTFYNKPLFFLNPIE